MFVFPLAWLVFPLWMQGKTEAGSTGSNFNKTGFIIDFIYKKKNGAFKKIEKFEYPFFFSTQNVLRTSTAHLCKHP